MSLHLDLVHAYAACHGARATWFVRAWDAADVLAKTGVVGTHDRLVACADRLLLHPRQMPSFRHLRA